MKSALLILILLSLNCAADDRGYTLFGGLGLQRGTSSLNPGGGAEVSHFTSNGYLLEGGATTGSADGAQFSAEIGAGEGTNTLGSSNYLETNKLSYFSAKAALYFGAFTVGGGYRHNDLTVESISLAPAGYLHSTYAGWTPLAFANLTLDIRHRYRTTIETQYVTGTLQNGEGLSPMKFNDLSVSLRFFVVFD